MLNINLNEIVITEDKYCYENKPFTGRGTSSDGWIEYFKDGLSHNSHGVAIEHLRGSYSKYYYLDGVLIVWKST